MNKLLIPLTPLLLCGCQEKMPNAAADQPGSAALRGCDQTNRLLGQMAGAERSFTYDKAGNATVSDELWNTMSPELRDGLVKAIAYQAMCSAGEPREQSVTIRSSGTKRVLAEKTVDDFKQQVGAP